MEKQFFFFMGTDINGIGISMNVSTWIDVFLNIYSLPLYMWFLIVVYFALYLLGLYVCIILKIKIGKNEKFRWSAVLWFKWSLYYRHNYNTSYWNNNILIFA